MATKKSKVGKQKYTAWRNEVDSDNDENVATGAADDNDVSVTEEDGPTPSKGKSAFSLLADLTSADDVDQDSEEEKLQSETSAPSSAPLQSRQAKVKKTTKKEGKKLKTEDDEELDKLLEQLDAKPSEKGSKATKLNPENAKPLSENQHEDTQSSRQDKKLSRKQKKQLDFENFEEDEADIDKQPAKKNVANKDLPESDVQQPDGQNGTAEHVNEAHVRTAAEKRREKKEREREQAKKKPPPREQPAKAKENENEATSVAAPKVEAPASTEAVEPVGSGDEGDAEEKKAGKKKKKPVEDKDAKKKPGNKQLAAMKEAMKKLEEEKEKALQKQREEEQKQREAEERYLEKIRLEKERKDKKKEKEKERIARLKAEGKYLTAEQKQKLQRQKQMVQMLAEQGYEVPGLKAQAEKPKRPVYTKKPKRKDESEVGAAQKGDDAVADNAPEISAVDASGEDVQAPQEEDTLVDSWDQIDLSPVKSVAQSAKMERGAANKGSDDGDETDEDESEAESQEGSSDGSTEDDEEDISESTGADADSRKPETKEEREQRIRQRMKKTYEDNDTQRSWKKMRSPVICVLGHVDTGKTKILDMIRKTHVQDSEAGGITQQIGATMVPASAIKEQTKMVKDFNLDECGIPGLLIIDTPGHESFSNLRSRGSSLCDVAILVVDIMHGLEPQTVESLQLLLNSRTPFVIALNKIDRVYEWKRAPQKDIRDCIKSQSRNCELAFQDLVNDTVRQFAERGVNARLFNNVPKDPAEFREWQYMVPTSALSADGMGNMIAFLVQYLMRLARLEPDTVGRSLQFSPNLECKVLEVKALPGLGTTIDVILIHGTLHVGDTIIVAGTDGPIVTQIRELLMPEPLREMRVKNPYVHHKEVSGAQGVKILGKDLEKTLAGLPLYVAQNEDEADILKQDMAETLKKTLQSIKLSDHGVYVQASTLGSLEALLEFLRTSKIPYSGINIGPVHKKDVMKASTMLEHEDAQYAMILGFDVRVERDAQEMADQLGVRIFQADIIYHLFDAFTKFREEWKEEKRRANQHLAVFPCKLKILPQFIFNSRNPIVMGVNVEAGVLRKGTPICVPSKEFLSLGAITSIQINHKDVDVARAGQEVCIKIEGPNDAPKMYGRHFDENDLLVSKISRETIDVCKQYFRDDLQKADWQLIVELKKVFGIV